MFKEGTLIDLLITKEGKAFLAPGCTDVHEGDEVTVDGVVLHRVVYVVSVCACEALNKLRRIYAVVKPVVYMEDEDDV